MPYTYSEHQRYIIYIFCQYLFKVICLLKIKTSKYLMDFWTDFNETFRNQSLGEVFKAKLFEDHYYRKLAAQTMQWLEYDSVKPTNIGLKFGVVITESHSQHTVFSEFCSMCKIFANNLCIYSWDHLRNHSKYFYIAFRK